MIEQRVLIEIRKRYNKHPYPWYIAIWKNGNQQWFGPSFKTYKGAKKEAERRSEYYKQFYSDTTIIRRVS